MVRGMTVSLADQNDDLRLSKHIPFDFAYSVIYFALYAK
uniref:Uncharacterized protein n=1 Tax=uncultured Rhodospirillales bacterium HF0500_23A22 TaxID=723611 RepID=E7C5H8_9PROT|nr:hypothetical protein [uncultured Rhodospirillales bacterium HF0500_23A22]